MAQAPTNPFAVWLVSMLAVASPVAAWALNVAGVMLVAGENAAPSAWLVWLQLERLVPARRMKAKATSAVNRRAPHLGARGKAGFAQDVFIEGQYIPRRRRWWGAPNGRLWFRPRAACAGRFRVAVWYVPATVKVECLRVRARCVGFVHVSEEGFGARFGFWVGRNANCLLRRKKEQRL